MILKSAAVLVGAVLASAALAAPASAAEPRTGQLTCTDSSSYTVQGQLNGSAWNIIGSTSNFRATYIEGEDGTVYVKRSTGKDKLGDLRCTYRVDGRTAYVEGYLTPRR